MADLKKEGFTVDGVAIAAPSTYKPVFATTSTKVCMWLLVVVGAVIDQLLLYASQTVGVTLPFTFLVACIVAIWIICNEIISILENIKDMGVTIPAFLIPLVTHVKSQVEDKVNMDNKEGTGDE